ncbi:universal stress protein, partial [Rhizobium ruizarguesonis]
KRGLTHYLAKRVSVLSLTGEKPLPETSGAHLAEILVSSGVNASATAARFTSSSIGLRIQRAALELGADLLVMGGFGQSRLRDFVLGG